jgi:Exo-beta-D-glucosaminidase Ig-fold domain/Glycosyl hydrolases family 2/Glycosyl hydrolases family 2, sugar binding domain
MTDTPTSQLTFANNRIQKYFSRLMLAAGLALAWDGLAAAGASVNLPEPITLSSGWLMQDVAQVKATGDVISKVGFAPAVYQPMPYVPPSTTAANQPTATKIPDALRFAPRGPRGGGGGSPAGLAEGWPLNPEPNRPSFSSGWAQAPAPSSPAWYQATVPGTILTTLVTNNVYPEPLYGENNRPNIIPESLSRTAYWYRTQFTVPKIFADKQIWLNFDGINYIADVWVNGTQAGTITGAFMRGNFNVTALVKPGAMAAVAVLIHPPPHPGDPWEKTVANQRGPNGGGANGTLGLDGPTFVASIGWDWVPGIRDRQMGIWQKVTLSASGPVLVKNPYVTTDLPLPKTDSANVSIEATVQNISDTPQTGVFTGKFGDITFKSDAITLPAKSSQVVKLNPATTPQLRIANPKLWWPNGLGEPHLYQLHLSFDLNGASSDTKDLNVGIRTITYTLPSMAAPRNLVLIVNGVPVFAKGGNWGMDEALKRIPAERLDAQVKLHRVANYNIIRNWVGQATSEDFYAACDKYGIMIWNDFFLANGANGLPPADPALFLSNVRDTVLAYRNHPAIAVWCARNETDPPAAIDAGNRQIIAELDPARFYQPNSAQGNGASSNGGGYSWRAPATFYANANFAFNTECGTASIPNLESIQSWLPEKDWFGVNFPNDDWAEHDLVTGAGNAAGPGAFQNMITTRYGAYHNLPEFVRKAQLANYEDFRAMYESRAVRMFAPCTAIITWMSNPAQPCFVWQVYDYTLDPFSSFFGVQKACEPVHIMMTQDAANTVAVINNSVRTLEGFKARVQIYNLDGTKKYDETAPVPTAAATAATRLAAVPSPEGLSPVHFVKLDLLDAAGKIVSDNFYWRETVANNFTALDTIPDVALDSKIKRHDANGKCLLDVTLTNPTKNVAVMAHVQLRNQRTNARVLPIFYTDNYVSLLPGESKTITIEAAAKDLGSDRPLVVLDGWNVTTKTQNFTTGGRSSIAPNTNAIVVRPAAKVAAN